MTIGGDHALWASLSMARTLIVWLPGGRSVQSKDQPFEASVSVPRSVSPWKNSTRSIRPA